MTQKLIGVKPLEWKEVCTRVREAEVADSILGRWEIWKTEGKVYTMTPGAHQGTLFEDTYEEAKAYLERVYLRRISPALIFEEAGK